jgi:hypothetical protein
MLFSGSCTRKESALHDVAPAPQPSAAASASADFVDAESDQPAKVSAWTDPPIVEKLQTDCAFDPRKMTDAERKELFENVYGADELMCFANAFDQSCAYDPCHEKDLYDCRRGCLNACDACSDTCMSSCFSCKANCLDGVCRHACAPTCAQCKQTCLTNADQCRSGKCEQVFDDCHKRLDASWKAQNCASLCRLQYSPCTDACVTKRANDKSRTFDNNACIAACKHPLNTNCDLGLCDRRDSMDPR